MDFFMEEQHEVFKCNYTLNIKDVTWESLTSKPDFVIKKYKSFLKTSIKNIKETIFDESVKEKILKSLKSFKKLLSLSSELKSAGQNANKILTEMLQESIANIEDCFKSYMNMEKTQAILYEVFSEVKNEFKSARSKQSFSRGFSRKVNSYDDFKNGDKNYGYKYDHENYDNSNNSFFNNSIQNGLNIFLNILVLLSGPAMYLILGCLIAIINIFVKICFYTCYAVFSIGYFALAAGFSLLCSIGFAGLMTIAIGTLAGLGITFAVGHPEALAAGAAIGGVTGCFAFGISSFFF